MTVTRRNSTGEWRRSVVCAHNIHPYCCVASPSLGATWDVMRILFSLNVLGSHSLGHLEHFQWWKEENRIWHDYIRCAQTVHTTKAWDRTWEIYISLVCTMSKKMGLTLNFCVKHENVCCCENYDKWTLENFEKADLGGWYLLNQYSFSKHFW